ncbi:DinB family protein [Algisphaera agarilytica]|uniref:Putative damage-inducible protein DinB n=1 Tax=Algisphaera agarilytica TaxID=1385975 RepID=A0A7X0LKP9_9BACT|nr:DinB family protein [Algisphaera agarilytica]MBB6430157.1 putative damage-inducible protein DinB [Algisphaera agarilytica]
MNILDRLLRHDADTTRKLLQLAAGLSDEDLDRTFDLGLDTLRKTFWHMIDCHESWLDQMKGRPARDENWRADISVAELIKRHDAVCEELYAFAKDIEDNNRLNETFIDHWMDPPRRKTFGGCIVHLATHAMHHRAQLLFMLRRLGVEGVPEGDALTWENQARGGWEPA